MYEALNYVARLFIDNHDLYMQCVTSVYVYGVHVYTEIVKQIFC